MKLEDKISVRANCEEEAISNALNVLALENKSDIDINKITLKFDGTSQVYDIYYNYCLHDNSLDGNHYEIERKFLVKDDLIKLGYDYDVITQSYIGFNPTSRVRRIGNKYFYTEKSVGTLVRCEEEKEISQDIYLNLLRYRVGKSISKNRYKIPIDNGLVAELDIYLGDFSGLKTVEVEFKSMEDALSFVKPDWFGEDITDDLRYKNDNLAITSVADIYSLINDSISKTR